MAILAAQVHSPEIYDIELQQAWHALHSAAQRSSVRFECNDASMDGAQLDYVQYCQVWAGRRVVQHTSHNCTLPLLSSQLGLVSFLSVHIMIAVTLHTPELTKLLLQAAAGCDSRLAGHLTASAFLRFRRSASGSVSAAAVHEYLARRTAMLELVRLS